MADSVPNPAAALRAVDKLTNVLVAAALDYAALGWRVFPCKPKDKRPLIDKWQHKASTDPAQIHRWWDTCPDANLAIATGEASGLFVLDVDPRHGGDTSLDALEAKHGKLPDTPQVITGTGGMHYFFRYVDRIRNSANQVGAGCDIRGEGGYVVAAPSIHPGTGEAYEWEASSMPDTTPLADAPGWLIEAASKGTSNSKPGGLTIKGAVSINAGGRNDYLTRVGGSMRASGMAHDELLAGLLAVNQSRCMPPLRESEVVTIAQSVARYVPTEGELEDFVAELNKNMALCVVGGKERVLREYPDGRYTIDTISAVKTLMANRKCVVGNRERNLFNVWLYHDKRRTYPRGITFTPGGESPGAFNTWRGFAVEPAKGDCQRFLDHVFANICREDEQAHEYVMAWLADAAQRPATRPGTALVLRGEQGVGKGIFATEVGTLFGPHFKHLVHSGSLTGRFNSHLEDALLVYSDEAFWAGDRQAEGAIKALITEGQLLFERKGIDAQMQPNYVRLIMSSNHDWVVPAGMHERRFCILDVANTKRQDSAYFGRIRAQMNSGGRAALLYYLLEMDISAIDLRAIPKTPAYVESQELSLDPVSEFWFDRLRDGTQIIEGADWQTSVGKDALYECYTEEMRRRNIRGRTMGRDAFLRKTYQLTGAYSRQVGGRTKRERVTEFPDLEISHAYFFEKTGIRVDDR